MNSEIDKLKSEIAQNREYYESVLRAMREEKRSREEEFYQVHNRDSAAIDELSSALRSGESNLFDTNKDILTLWFEFGQREREYVEEVEGLKHRNAQLRNKLHGLVQNTVAQTEVFSRNSELQTEDLANKFRMQ